MSWQSDQSDRPCVEDWLTGRLLSRDNLFKCSFLSRCLFMVPLPCGDSHTWEALEGGKRGRSGGQREREKVNKEYLMSGRSRFRCSKGFHLLHEIRVQIKSSGGGSLRQLQQLASSFAATFCLSHFFQFLFQRPLLKFKPVQKRKCGPLLRPDRTLGSQSSSWILLPALSVTQASHPPTQPQASALLFF